MNIIRILYNCCFGYIVLLLSYITPRFKNKWCFGGVDNAKYLFLLTDFKKMGIRAIWYSNDHNLVKRYKRLGYEAYTKTSFAGLYHLLTAKIYVITHGYGDINKWTTGRAKVVHLFHGLPIKKIAYDDNKHSYSFSHLIANPHTNRPFDLQLSTSPFIEEIFKRSFRVRDNNYVESQFPRNLILLKEKHEINGFLERLEDTTTKELISKIQQFSQAYIYMPTFRDTQRDFISDAGFDFEKLSNCMKDTDSLFIFKLHRATKSIQLSSIKKYPNLMQIEQDVDVYPLLPFTCGLITDYSSIYFDYILMRGCYRVIFYPFDKDSYTKVDRELNMDESYMKGEYCYDFQTLLKTLSQSPDKEIDQSEIIKTIWNNHKDCDALIKAMIELSNS